MSVFNGGTASVLVNTAHENTVVLDMEKGDNIPVEFKFYAPQESGKNYSNITKKQREANKKQLENCARLRAEKKHDFKDRELQRILKTLPQKDRDYFNGDILRKHSDFMARYEDKFSAEIYEKEFLCPRIFLEPLSFYAGFIDSFFSCEQKTLFKTGFNNINSWVNENIIQVYDNLSFLPATPIAVLKTGHGSKYDKRTLAAAIAKTFGVLSEMADKKQETGKYVSARLPNGDIIVNTRGEMPLPPIEDMVQKIPVDGFLVEGENSADIIGTENKIFIWLDTSAEPTEHILNELYEKRGQYKKHKPCMIVRNEKQLEDELLNKVKDALGINKVFIDNGDENVNTLARKMYLDPDTMPLIVFMNRYHEIVYAVSGYNVGTADLLLQLIKLQ